MDLRESHTPPGPLQRFSSLFTASLIAIIRIYQRVVSPWLPAQCRFTPSCSQFAVEALRIHGPIRGGFMAVARLLRCHPRHPGGWDPVPPGASREKGRENGQEDAPRHPDGHRGSDRLSGLVRTEAPATAGPPRRFLASGYPTGGPGNC